MFKNTLRTIRLLLLNALTLTVAFLLFTTQIRAYVIPMNDVIADGSVDVDNGKDLGLYDPKDQNTSGNSNGNQTDNNTDNNSNNDGSDNGSEDDGKDEVDDSEPGKEQPAPQEFWQAYGPMLLACCLLLLLLLGLTSMTVWLARRYEDSQNQSIQA